MSASAAALSERDITHTSRPREVNAHAPATLEDWEADLWRRAGQRLSEFYFLPEDWDGEGAEAPSSNALTAGDYLRRLYLAGGRPPTAVSLTPLGTIVLEWRRGDDYLEAEISGAHEIGWMERAPNGSYRVRY